MCDVITAPEVGTQKIPPPPQVASRKSAKQKQEHQHQNDSETNHNPRGAPRSMTGITDTQFEDSSGDPIGIMSDKPTKDPSHVPITKSPSVPGETPTKYLSHVPLKVPSSNPRTC